jgi:predicted peptidase
MWKKSIIALFVLLLGIGMVMASDAPKPARAALPSKGIFKGTVGTIPYQLLGPKSIEEGKVYPLVLCLHGAGGRGNDNKGRGSQAFRELRRLVHRGKLNAFLLMPQCPKGKKWVNVEWRDGSYELDKVPQSDELKLVTELLKDVLAKRPVDKARIYVTGQSMGGFGSWDMVMRYPNLFAAAVPVCGSGDSRFTAALVDMPIWAFHGAKDTTVPVSGSRDMVKALRELNNKRLKYTEYPDVGHNSWQPTWKEEELIPWLFKQKREKPGTFDVTQQVEKAKDG